MAIRILGSTTNEHSPSAFHAYARHNYVAIYVKYNIKWLGTGETSICLCSLNYCLGVMHVAVSYKLD